MQGILRFLRQDDRWQELDKILTSAFEKVKGETKNIYSWVRYLREKDIQNDTKHELTSRELGEHDAMIRNLQMQVSMINEELKNIQRNQKSSQFTSPFPDQVRTKSGLEIRTKFENKILAISRPVKKEYVMRQIIELMEKEIYTTKQIENIVVKEKVLCGRTAFYDYLKELRLKNMVESQNEVRER